VRDALKGTVLGESELMLLAALLLAAMPSATVRLPESGSPSWASTAPSFGGWDLTAERC